MKLTKKIALQYYRIKFRLLGLFAPRKAASSAFELFCTPFSGKPERPMPLIFEKGEHLSVKIEGNLTLRGWKWEPEADIATNKKILILHGFDSYSYRFEKYIRPLKKEGFTIMAFDAPGHGISDGMGVSDWEVEITRPIDKFALMVSLPKRVKERMYKLIIRLGKLPVSYFDARRAIEQISIPTLWLHDQEDVICPYKDVLPIQALSLPHVTFYITKGLGHSNIYRDGQTVKTIVGFFSK